MGSRNLSRLLVCHSSNMFNILSIVEISVIFLAWQLNVWVRGQVCYPSKLIEVIHAREETVQVKMKPCTHWYFIQGDCIRAVWLNTHILRSQSCRSGVCVWNFDWSWWEVHISDSRWDLEYVKLLGQPIDGERRVLECPSNSSVDAEPSFFHASGSNIQNPKKTKQKHHLHPKHEMGVTGGEREKKKWQKSDLPFWEVNSCRKKNSLWWWHNSN